MHMRTTLILDDSLLERARQLSGLKEKTAASMQGNLFGQTSLFDLFRTPLVSQQSQIRQFSAVSEPSTARRGALDITV